jgi:lysophospholipase L1-like esterase
VHDHPFDRQHGQLDDDAPLDTSTLTPVATGTGVAVRCATYGTTGALVTAASGGAGHPLLGGVLDSAGAVEAFVGASTWKVDGVTARFTAQDGTHPSTNGHTLMAAAINPALFV